VLEIDINELKDLIRSGELPIYSGSAQDGFKKLTDEGFERALSLLRSLDPETQDWINHDCRFLKQDVERLIENSELEGLSSNERRELSRLRTFRKKLEIIIRASVKSGIFCQRMGQMGHPVKKQEIWDELKRLNCDDIPNEIFREIRRALPDELKKTSGRPKKI